jgi:hypothetical protein
MAWRYNEKANKVEFSGPIANWMQDISAWFKEDSKDYPQVAESSYIAMMVSSLANYAKGKWSKSLFGKKKVKKLDSFVSTDANGNISLNIWNTLDFLAENLSDNDRKDFSPYCRRDVKKLISKSLS